MRILYFLDQDFPDRQTQTIQVANMGVEFARLGIPMRLFVRRVLIPDRRELFAHFGLEPEDDFRIEGLYKEGLGKLNRWRGLPFLGHLADVLRRHGTPDTVIYARGLGAIEPARLATIAARPFGIPVVFEVHKLYGRTMDEYYRTESERREKGEAYLAKKRRSIEKIRRRETAMLRTVTGLVCINRGIEERLRDLLGPDRPITVIPSAAREPERIPADDERDLDVVYLGDIGRKKGVRLLVEAMTKVPGRRLLIHGKGRAKTSVKALEEAIRKHGLEDRVEYGGWIEPARIPPLLARARTSVVPYRSAWSETATFVSPLKVYELMLAGVPLVVSDLPSLREIVKHDETGLVVPPDDPDTLAAAIRSLLEDRTRATRLATAARVAARPFTWEGRARRVRDVLAKLSSR